MADKIIDSCSLLNLYTGWRGLSELKGLGHTWYVADSAVKEAQYTRDTDAEGRIITVSLRLDDLVQSGDLNSAKAESEEEVDLYVSLSSDLDDGEAEALAIAKVRGFVLLTDDAKAIKVAHRPELAVETVSTVRILQEWVSKDVAHSARAQEVLARIEKLARFRPPAGTEEFDWWRTSLKV